ncbi:MAG TPA: hypothetical protein VFR07_07495 [Mycobacteriales bacterium]|jgi:hypothetical protein|nr:hypothetical protein [Mycobacteriales bacterium]
MPWYVPILLAVLVFLVLFALFSGLVVSRLRGSSRRRSGLRDSDISSSPYDGRGGDVDQSDSGGGWGGWGGSDSGGSDSGGGGDGGGGGGD